MISQVPGKLMVIADFMESAFPTETVVITEDPDSEDEFGRDHYGIR